MELEKTGSASAHRAPLAARARTPGSVCLEAASRRTPEGPRERSREDDETEQEAANCRAQEPTDADPCYGHVRSHDRISIPVHRDMRARPARRFIREILGRLRATSGRAGRPPGGRRPGAAPTRPPPGRDPSSASPPHLAPASYCCTPTPSTLLTLSANVVNKVTGPEQPDAGTPLQVPTTVSASTEPRSINR